MSGRAPCDYFRLLPKALQRCFRNDVKRLYGRERLAEDCVQETMLQVLKYPYDLDIGPPLMSQPNQAWFVEAYAALFRFARAPLIRLAVAKSVYHNGGVQTEPEGNESEGKVDPNWEETINWSESRRACGKVIDLLREFIAEQIDFDPLEICVLDQLRRNANREFTDHAMDEVFRGDSFQIIHESLLKSLQQDFPSIGWNKDMVQVTIAKLRRHAEGRKKELLHKGMFVIDELPKRDSLAIQRKLGEHLQLGAKRRVQ